MGTNNFETKSPGDIISADDPNQYKTGLTTDHVPRNVSGVPTDVGGGLGTTVYRWATSYIREIYLGTAANLISITESASDFLVKVGGVTKMVVDVDGIDAAYLKVGSLLDSAFSNGEKIRMRKIEILSGSGNWTAPTDPTLLTEIEVEICGGGGGGGGGGGWQGNNGGGGAGGQGAQPIKFRMTVTPGNNYAYSVGAGGTSGAGAPGNNQDGSAGGSGGSTTFNGVTAHGGGGGGPGIKGGASPGAGGTNGGSGFTSNLTLVTGGGSGGAGQQLGAAGSNSPFASGGAAGGGGTGATRGGSGGGGGAGLAAGSNGADNSVSNAGISAGNATANTGSGAGGGSGSSASGGAGGSGGVGGSGYIKITYVAPEV